MDTRIILLQYNFRLVEDIDSRGHFGWQISSVNYRPGKMRLWRITVAVHATKHDILCEDYLFLTSHFSPAFSLTLPACPSHLPSSWNIAF